MSVRKLAVLGSVIGLLIFLKTFAQDFKEMTLVVDTPKGKREVYFNIQHKPGSKTYEATLNPEGGSGFLSLGSNAITVRFTQDQPPTIQDWVRAFSSTSDFEEGRQDDSLDYRMWLGALSVMSEHQKYGSAGKAFYDSYTGWGERVAIENDIVVLKESAKDVARLRDEDKKRREELQSRYVILERQYKALCEREGAIDLELCKRREQELKALKEQIQILGVSLEGDVAVLDAEIARMESLKRENKRREDMGKKAMWAQNAAASTRVDVEKILCCGPGSDAALNKIVPGYCEQAKQTESGTLSIDGFGSVALTDVCLDENAKKKSKLCFNDQAKCMYVDRSNELYIPFTGKVICAVNADASCTENPTKCARQQQELYTEHYGLGDPGIEKQLKTRFKGDVSAPSALEGK